MLQVRYWPPHRAGKQTATLTVLADYDQVIKLNPKEAFAWRTV